MVLGLESIGNVFDIFFGFIINILTPFIVFIYMLLFIYIQYLIIRFYIFLGANAVRYFKNFFAWFKGEGYEKLIGKIFD